MATVKKTAARNKPRNPKGRPPGIPNKATTAAREAIAAFVNKETPRLKTLLKKIEKEDGPLAAWKCIMDVIEYHVPKLQRTELTGKDGEALPSSFTFELDKPGKKDI